MDKNSFTPENQELEDIINFFQSRGLLKRRSNINSFHNCISAVKNFAEDNGADALTSLLTVQTWIVENKLKTDVFSDLKIIYHSSEGELKSIDGRIYRNESIITSSEAYKVLFALKAKATKESFKTWLEFSYKSYSHGKFLLSE